MQFYLDTHDIVKLRDELNSMENGNNKTIVANSQLDQDGVGIMLKLRIKEEINRTGVKTEGENDHK